MYRDETKINGENYIIFTSSARRGICAKRAKDGKIMGPFRTPREAKEYLREVTKKETAS